MVFLQVLTYRQGQLLSAFIINSIFESKKLSNFSASKYKPQMKYIALMGLGQVLLIIVLILFKNRKQTKDYLLAVVLFLIGCELFYQFMDLPVTQQSDNRIIILDQIYWALLGPVMLFYINFVTGKSTKFHYRYFIHLLPLIIILIPYVRYMSSGADVRFYHYIGNSDFLNKALVFMWDWATPAYFLVILFLIRAHKNQVRNYFSNLYKKDLKWAKYLTGGFFIYMIIGFALIYASEIVPLNLGVNLNHISIIVLEIYILGIGIYGYKQEQIFSESNYLEIQKNYLQSSLLQFIEKEKKYEKSGLTRDEQNAISAQLQTFMKEEKPYLDCDFTIGDLAEKLSTSVHKLSQVINEEFNQNFYEFINRYRIEEIKQYLHNPRYDHLKIMSLAYDCGFNSKSAFYAAFRKITDETPTEYRKKLQEKKEEVLAIEN